MSYTDQDFEQTAASHTPGPWRVYNPSRSGHYSTAKITSEADGHDVAALIPNGKNSERHVANLRLIAAAPDLLAALKALHHQCDYMGAPADHPDMLAAAAAIAKAEGRE